MSESAESEKQPDAKPDQGGVPAEVEQEFLDSLEAEADQWTKVHLKAFREAAPKAGRPTPGQGDKGSVNIRSPLVDQFDAAFRGQQGKP